MFQVPQGTVKCTQPKTNCLSPKSGMVYCVLFFVCLLVLPAERTFSQDLKTTVGNNKELDSLRKREEGGTDTVIYTAKFIRYTTLGLTKDSIQTLPLDTTLYKLQNFSVLVQPRHPTVGLGNLGLSAYPMLFEPLKTIGFDAGFHSLDYYAVNHEDLLYYQARAPFTSLYYVSAGDVEQVFKVVHSQNIKKNWNIALNYNRIGANGMYANQRGDHLNAAAYSWYTSPSKRYNLWIGGVFNTLKANENGSVRKDSIYVPGVAVIERESEAVRLGATSQLWRKNSFLLKQSYFIGRIDSVLNKDFSQKILPTNKISYTFRYTKSGFSFRKNESDDFSALPQGMIDPVYTGDSTSVNHIQNEFVYSFFLRPTSKALFKNELKIDAGIRHDFYKYQQIARYKDKTNFYDYDATFQNVTFLGNAGYRFSDRIDLNVNLQQIAQGRQIGDFLYEAKSNILLSNAVGRVVLGAYLQNKSPEQVFSRYFGNHYNWLTDFDRTKTVNLSFKYLNDKFRFDASAEYFLITDHLYFQQDTGLNILPMQNSAAMNLIKVTLGKKVNFGKFGLDSYVVFQKTDNPGILRTPEIYTFNTFYFAQTFFKVLKTNIGFDIRYNTPYKPFAYSAPASQFYLRDDSPEFASEPIVDVWLKASLRKANVFVKCDYVSQGLFSRGYYTIDRYPMQDRQLLKFGVQWNFYD